MKLIPFAPALTLWLAPWKEMWRKITTASLMWVPPVTLTLTPLPVLTRIEAQPDPCPPSMVRALVMVTAPKPPGSSTSISPPSAVFEIAPAKVLHGAVRLHGFASSPTPETQVRVAWPWANDANPKVKTTSTRTRTESTRCFIFYLLKVLRYREIIAVN